MLKGLMQDDYPLTVQHLLLRARTVNASSEVVTLEDPAELQGGRGVRRATYAQVGDRVDRLGHALQRLGLRVGDRVGTFAWNSQEHLELYLAVPCAGMVLHTLNIRLPPEQTVFIVNHAADRVVFVDDSLVPLIAPLVCRLPGVKHWVVMGDGPADALPGALRYDDLLAEGSSAPFNWPRLEERAAASLCYTSGTTGDPKGVLYSHRSIALHATGNCMADAGAICASDRLLPIVPMFHVNAWGTPFSAALTGASLLMPGRFLQGEPLARFVEAERATTIHGVPTVMADLLRYLDAHEVDTSSLERGQCGGSPVTAGLMRGFDRHGINLIQGWGMTETSPVCAVAWPPPCVDRDDSWSFRTSQGRVMPWVEMRIVGDEGPQPWDGESVGEVEVRGPWIASRYYGATDEDNAEKFVDGGWLRTGDIGTMDSRGYVRLTDRAKDLIKSGGEWISSVELENAIMEHAGVREAAVIAKPDEKWAERPLACVVLEPGAELDAQSVREHLRPLVAKWWLPEEIVFIDEIPKTSVGKFDKKVLRQRLAVGELIQQG